MSLIFEKIAPLADLIADKFEKISTRVTEPGIEHFDWYNKVYTNYKFRRAHIEVLDRTEKNNMWIMHVTVFPHLNDPSPIFGFDIVCTGKKVSGIFHDFSITTNDEHYMQKGFEGSVRGLSWKKERELPDWGKKIFSKSMIAAGGISTEQELEQIINVCLRNLDYYLANVGTVITLEPISAVREKQNYYCKCQKENPYPVRMLINFGLTKEQAENFVNNHLFPEVS